MNYEKLLRLLFKGQCPGQKTILISVSADVVKHLDVGFHINAFTKELHFLRTVHQGTANGADSLVSGKDHRTFPK